MSILLGLALCARPGLADSAVGTEPRITGIRVDGGTVVVSAQVPAGIKKVTLQSSRRLGPAGWEPRAVLRLDGTGGTVTFEVPRSSDLEIVRVRADETEPLPPSFYKGTNAFPGVPLSTSSSNPGELVPGTAAGGAGGGAVDDRSAIGTAPTAAPRDVVESDIWKTQGTMLYFFNQYRGLQAIDLTNPDAPVVRGTLSLPAAGEQMYVLSDKYLVLLARNGCGWAAESSSQVLVVSIAGVPTIQVALPLTGDIQESRLVGTALYVTTQTYRTVADSKDGSWEWGTAVYGFDLADPTAPVAKPSLWFSGYGNVLNATDQFLFVAVNDSSNGSQVHFVDISAPDGTLGKAGSIRVAGSVPDKFKMQLNGDVFTVISEKWSADGTGRWRPVTKLETFSLADATAPLKLGELELANGEQLHATRFDGNRVYVVTFFQVDPLWVVDLSDPAHPAIKGELKVPGWSTYIQPVGDRLLAIGIDNTNGWRVAVSLFDVHDASAPTLLSKVPLGVDSSWSEANYDEKAFGFVPEAGLILVPYSTYSTNNQQGVQLIDYSDNALVQRGFINHNLPARRSTLYHDRILSISGRELLSVDASNRDKPVVRSETELAWPVNRVFVQGEYLIEVENASYGDGSLPTVRVASTARPDQVLNALSLANIPVSGATVRDGRLFLLQGATTYYPPVVLSPDKGVSGEGTNQTVLRCSVIDLGKLPALEAVGSTERVSADTFYGSAQAVWPNSNLLLWVTQQSSYWRGWYPVDAIGGIAGIGGSAGVGIMPIRGGPGYWGSSGQSELFAVDASKPASPQFVSDVSLTSTNGWATYSKPYTADNLVFLSQQINQTSITGTNYFVTTNVEYVVNANFEKVPQDTVVTNEQPVYTSTQITYLHVIDYSTPALPVRRQPITIPGALNGVSGNGALLYLVGYRVDDKGVTDGTEWLHACAYDGVASYLVDSHPLPQEWPYTLLVSGSNVFVTRPEVDKTSSRAVETWELNGTGKFAKLSERPLTANASALQVVNDLLVAQEDNNLELFNLSNPTVLPWVGAGWPSGCLWPTIDSAGGSVQSGLWLPLDLYGVYHIQPKP